MLSLPSSVRIFFCIEPCDMRRSFDGLERMVREIIETEPMNGHLFVFINKRRDRLKILHWDRTGYVIWYKLLERGTFEQLPVTADQRSVILSATDLMMILEGIDLGRSRRRRRWSPPERKPA